MNWLGKAVNRLTGVDIESRLMESMTPQQWTELVEALLPTPTLDPSDPPKHWFRSLSKDMELKDLDPIDQDRMLRLAFWLYDTNPLAKRLIDLTLYYVTGKGIGYQSDDEKVKAHMDLFWYDPANRLDYRQFQFPFELGLYGELCLTANVETTQGLVRLGYIDPLYIQKVWTDPKNVLIPIGVELKTHKDAVPSGGGGVLRDGAFQGGPRYRIIQAGDGSALTDLGKQWIDKFTDGFCFYWSINTVANSPRGRSDLLTVIDWLARYEKFLFNRGERSEIINNFIYKVVMRGGTPAVLEAERKRLEGRRPKPATFVVTNENYDIGVLSPSLTAQDADTDGRMFRNHIVGNRGFPEFWFGYGGEVNYATSLKQGAPTFKFLENRQMMFRMILEEIIDYHLKQGAKAGALAGVDLDDPDIYQVVFPAIDMPDLAVTAGALSQFTIALATAVNMGLISKESSQAIFTQYLNSLGYKVDAQAELDKMEQDQLMETMRDLVWPDPGGNGKDGKGAKQLTAEDCARLDEFLRAWRREHSVV